MWTFFSDILAHLVIAIGITACAVGFLLPNISILSGYAMPLRVLGILCLCVGLFFEGKLSSEKEWQDKVHEAELKVAKLEIQSAEVTTQVQTQVVEKTRTIREKGSEIIKYIDRDVVKKEDIIKYIDSCPLPEDFVTIHNNAALAN